MLYCKVVNGEIVEYNRMLPFSTKDTSFGKGTDDETMRAFGYLPVIGSEPVLEYNQRVSNVSYVVGEDSVSKVYEVVTLSDEEILAQKTPNSITQRQCRLQLVKEGLYDAVNTALGGMDAEAQIEWEYASEIQRDNVLVSAIQSALNKDDNWMNQFFIDASVL